MIIHTLYLGEFRQIFYTLRAFDKKSYEGTFVRTLVKASYIVASKPVCTGIWAGTSISYWCKACVLNGKTSLFGCAYVRDKQPGGAGIKGFLYRVLVLNVRHAHQWDNSDSLSCADHGNDFRTGHGAMLHVQYDIIHSGIAEYFYKLFARYLENGSDGSASAFKQRVKIISLYMPHYLLGDRLERGGLCLDPALCGKTLNVGCAEETVDLRNLVNDVCRIIGLGNRSAVADDHDVGADGAASGNNGLYLVNAVVKSKSGLGTDGTLGGKTHVGDENIGTCLSHGLRLFGVEHVRAGQHVKLMRLAYHLYLKTVAHAGLLKILAEYAVDKTDGREVLHAVEALCLELTEVNVHPA